MPNEPAKYILIGHKHKINAVSLDPLYSVIASASVEAPVKIWDWDSGELERTLKSHTKVVPDCQFDSTFGDVFGRSLYEAVNVPDDYKILLPLEGTNTPSRVFPSDQGTIRSFPPVGIIQSGCGISKQVIRPQEEWIRSAIPSLDGLLLLPCSDDHTARITDLVFRTKGGNARSRQPYRMRRIRTFSIYSVGTGAGIWGIHFFPPPYPVDFLSRA